MALLPGLLQPAPRDGRPQDSGGGRHPLTSELAVALALDRLLRLRAVPEVHPIPSGFVVRHPELADVYHLNAVLLVGPLADEIDADALEALADRWLSDREHRQVVIDDAPGGEKLAAALGERGWERMRSLFMAFAGDPRAALRDPRAREISESELRAIHLRIYRLEYPARRFSRDLPAHLVAGQVALRAGTAAMRFAAGENGGLQSTCTLFLDPDGPCGRVAMVEEVGTLPEYRGRGLAAAVVSAAIRAAGEWGADLIVVPADADNWPQLLYAKLGFVPIGKQVSFTRRLGPDRGSERGAV